MSKKAQGNKSLTVEQLKDENNNLKKQLMVIRFKKVSGELANTAEAKLLRRSIARNLTLINKMNKEEA